MSKNNHFSYDTKPTQLFCEAFFEARLRCSRLHNCYLANRAVVEGKLPTEEKDRLELLSFSEGLEHQKTRVNAEMTRGVLRRATRKWSRYLKDKPQLDADTCLDFFEDYTSLLFIRGSDFSIDRDFLHVVWLPPLKILFDSGESMEGQIPESCKITWRLEDRKQKFLVTFGCAKQSARESEVI